MHSLVIGKKKPGPPPHRRTLNTRRAKEIRRGEKRKARETHYTLRDTGENRITWTVRERLCLPRPLPTRSRPILVSFYRRTALRAPNLRPRTPFELPPIGRHYVPSPTESPHSLVTRACANSTTTVQFGGHFESIARTLLSSLPLLFHFSTLL